MPNVEVGVGEDGKVIVRITSEKAQSTLAMTTGQAEAFSDMLTQAVASIGDVEPTEIVPTHAGTNAVN